MNDVIFTQYPDIVAMRETGVLIDERPSGLPEDAVMVSFTCSDGHRIQEIFKRQIEMHKCNVHLIALNGGAMLLSDACPANNEFPLHRGLADMVIASCAIKNTQLIALGSHWPCAVAAKYGLSVDDVLTLTVHGHNLIEARRPDLKAFCFFHVAHPNGRPRTYTIEEKHEHFKHKVLLLPA